MNQPSLEVNTVNIDPSPPAPRLISGRAITRAAPRLMGVTMLGVFLAMGCAGARNEPAASKSKGDTPARSMSAEPAGPPKAGEAPLEDAAESEEDASADEAGAFDGPAPESEAEPSLEVTEKKERSPASMLAELDGYLVSFDAQLDPQRLSCDGARPIKDAICSIAQRICDLSDPGSLNKPADCKRASDACKKAQSDYDDKCE